MSLDVLNRFSDPEARLDSHAATATPRDPPAPPLSPEPLYATLPWLSLRALTPSRGTGSPSSTPSAIRVNLETICLLLDIKSGVKLRPNRPTSVLFEIRLPTK